MKEKSLNHPALERLFREYFRPLTLFAMQYVGEQAIAEDIVQDLFLNLYEKNESLKIHSSEINYLYTSIRNRCLKHLKHKQVRVKNNPAAQEALNSSPEDPHELAVIIEFEHKYVQILESLSPKCREVFEMSRLEGKKNQEIAEELQLSKRTVETHISQALKVLKKKLRRYITIFL